MKSGTDPSEVVSSSRSPIRTPEARENLTKTQEELIAEHVHPAPISSGSLVNPPATAYHIPLVADPQPVRFLQFWTTIFGVFRIVSAIEQQKKDRESTKSIRTRESPSSSFVTWKPREEDGLYFRGEGEYRNPWNRMVFFLFF